MGVAKWWKVDFHTHTPASRCFKNYKVVNEDIRSKQDLAMQWISKCIERGIQATVVCDHNSLEWIETIREANKSLENKVIIFPGIEICLTINRMHVIVIFDPSTTEDMHRTFIEQCKIPITSWGDTIKYISENDLIEAIEYFKKEYKEKIIIIPAHFDKNKGMGRLLTDEDIKQFLRKISIDAIEVRDQGGEDLVNSKIESKVLPAVATIIGSDNPGEREGEHSVDGLGEKYTWVKMSEPSLEGLRQALLDPESRIIKVVERTADEEDPNRVNHNYLAGMTIHKLKHIEKINVRFSPNLNCIVGPRGAGKSTLVESIKLALNKGYDLKNSKVLYKTYKAGSQIDLYYNFGSSKPYMITINGSRTSPKWTIVDSNRSEIESPPEFSSTIFGQKEIYNLVENEDDIEKNESSPLLEIIDNNIIADKIDIQEKIRDKKNEILNLVNQLDNTRRKLKEIPKVKAELENSNNKLEKFRTSGILEKKEKLDKLNSTLKTISDWLEELSKTKERLIYETVEKIEDFKNFTDSVSYDEGKILISEIMIEIRKVELSLKQFKNESYSRFSAINEIIRNSKLLNSIAKVEKEYKEFLNNNKDIQLDKYKEILDNNSKNINNLRKLENEEVNKDEIKKKILTKVDEYIEEAIKLTNKRREILQNINLSAENIRLTINPLSHGMRWLQNIRRDVGKKDNFDSIFLHIYNTLFENDVLDLDKYKEWLKFILTTNTGDINEFLIDKELDPKFKTIWINKFKDNTLSSLFGIDIEDRIDIKIINGNQEIGINEGSPGQKSAAILAFILNQGTEPLIIDQPEDDLDNSLIIKLVVDNIRKQKSRRQIIIVTHNPNIPVLGDAEGIIMLDRNDNGDVALKFNKSTGCIEEKMIKKGICEIMEGGLDAFKKREHKYKYLKI
ncbi:TrlF family AAA-like ATPase [Desulfosporosinus sp. FKA]|uniref:TrlF family AAA-like ATPase n=1 Tax=Desulfosporosinus sp. FKA TaxID=1969834 RepID=UPI0015581DA8|nr:AAA family ATPase [Desulfosporosinus sp. FKA]